MRATALLLLIALFPTAASLSLADKPGRASRADTGAPFRTDDANANLPWYRLKPGVFPPLHSEHRVGGELVETDYIHRCGVFRMDGTGERIEFALLPFGNVRYLNTEADLRDVPIGTHLLFSMYQDEKGVFSRVIDMQDDYTVSASQGLTYKLNALQLDSGRLTVTQDGAKLDAKALDLLVNAGTRVWKGDKQIKLSDLVVGDTLLINSTGSTRQRPAHCTDIYVGADTRKVVTERLRKSHTLFLKERGLPAWIDSVDGNKMTVTLFSSDPAALKTLFKQESIDPAELARDHRRFSVAVATQHLRTYNPPVLDKWATVEEYQELPAEGYGCGGVRWVIQPELMLEGFRKGSFVRIFANPAWPIEAQPFGEGLGAGGHDEEPADSKELQPAEFPYRTDFGNEDQGWYQLKPTKFPPDHSEHRVGGELIKVDSAHRRGTFRMDRTGTLVDFTMPPFGAAMLHNADAELEDLPLNRRYLFFLYQDDKGAFTRAGVIMDEFTYFTTSTLTYRFEKAILNEGKEDKLVVVRHAAPVPVDYVLEPRVPTDFGRIELEVDEKTRVWKGDKQIKLADLMPGDELIVNTGARTAYSRGRCTDIWVGSDTFHTATEQQRLKHAAYVKQHGLPAWIESVDGQDITIDLFAGSRPDIIPLLGPDPYGKSVGITLADEDRNAVGSIDYMGFKTHLPEIDTEGTYGCSGIRWVIHADKLPDGYRKGSIVRIFP